MPEAFTGARLTHAPGSLPTQTDLVAYGCDLTCRKVSALSATVPYQELCASNGLQ